MADVSEIENIDCFVETATSNKCSMTLVLQWKRLVGTNCCLRWVERERGSTYEEVRALQQFLHLRQELRHHERNLFVRRLRMLNNDKKTKGGTFQRPLKNGFFDKFRLFLRCKIFYFYPAFRSSSSIFYEHNFAFRFAFKMSLLPLFYRDWWDDFERPSRIFDQNFGLGLRRDDLISSFFNNPYLRSGYVRPWRELDRQSSGSSVVQVEKDKFQVILDVQQFAPNEIVVKTQDRVVVVEGKHEEKQDEHGFISRHFVRKYILPSDIEPTEITSSLSSDGVLTISAPKKSVPAIAGERVVPIAQTGMPAVKSVTESKDTPVSAPGTPSALHPEPPQK